MRRRARADHRRRSEPLRPRPLPAPPPPLRPARGVALVRAELAVATGDGLARRRRRSEVDPRRRDRHRRASRSRSSRRTRARITGIDITEAMLRQGHDRVARQARPTACNSWSARPSACRSPTRRSTRSRSPISCVTSLIPGETMRELVRVLAPGAAIASLEFAVPPTGSGASGGGATRVACYRSRATSPAGANGAGSGAFSAPTSPRTTGVTRSTGPSRPGRTPGLVDVGRSVDEPRRWPRDVGPEARVTSCAPRSTPHVRAVGATGGRCSTRPTPRGTFPTSSSGRRSPPTTDGRASSRHCWRSSSPSASPPTRSTSCTDVRCEPTFRAGGWSASGSAAWSLPCALGVAGVATVGLGLARVHRDRPAARARLQPRAVRRLDPHRLGLRRGVGRVPGARWLFRPGGTARYSRGAGSRCRASPLARAAIVEHAGAHAPGTSPARAAPSRCSTAPRRRSTGRRCSHRSNARSRRSRGQWSRSRSRSSSTASSSWPRPSTCGRGSAAELREVGPADR